MLISSAVDTVEELLEQYKPYLSPKPSKQEKKKKNRGRDAREISPFSAKVF